MIIKNARVFGKSFEPESADIEIENGIITSVEKNEKPGLDFSDCVVLPGFIDIHIHGCNLADTTDGNSDSVLKMSSWLCKQGVTSFCPTTMTLPAAQLRECFGYAANAMGNESGAYIHGINMEGPFISHDKKGAQAEEYISEPNFELFSELNSICPVKLVDIAPEAAGATEFIKQAGKICTVSAAHTAAGYEQGKAAFAAGITHATHLFNAMLGLGSREPGMVGAVFDSDSITAELICDGIHISPATLRIAFKILGEDRTVIISDALMAAGLDDGEYMLGGQRVIKHGAARLEDGTLAGSSTNLFEEFHNVLKFGIPLRQAIKSVTINPARAIGVDKITGSIEPNKNADLLILSSDLSEIKAVFVKGKQVL